MRLPAAGKQVVLAVAIDHIQEDEDAADDRSGHPRYHGGDKGGRLADVALFRTGAAVRRDDVCTRNRRVRGDNRRPIVNIVTIAL